ncbi:ribosome modulation factor [Microbulbifer sp. SAOS-129_SWC]|uniref:ribosome modulation factor n=1 Tax=Microbulbifer sp. SAOS-129_SWC TaxID=3145235 RepID=UPI003216F7A1
MKRQKRNHTERAFYKGYLAAMNNKAEDSCPFVNGNSHQEWINGWREGREDYWNGLDETTKAQKLEIYRTVSTNIHYPDGWSTI